MRSRITLLYFPLRKPILHPCCTCERGVTPDAAFCQRCGQPQMNLDYRYGKNLESTLSKRSATARSIDPDAGCGIHFGTRPERIHIAAASSTWAIDRSGRLAPAPQLHRHGKARPACRDP